MINAKLSEITSLVAFPHDVALNQKGKFVGFVMRRLQGHRPLHELYSPKSRQKHFPSADYRFLVRAAANMARAVASVHQSECIIGDLNHSGVLVAKDATIALIDADSFQFKFGSQFFHCAVGVPDFTPPELHGVNLKTVRRTLAHDNFALAVGIFHLLFMGRHPYAGRYTGRDISLGDAIAEHRFAFSLIRRGQTNTLPPPGVIGLEIFSAPVRDAFENAFGVSPEARPSAMDWVRLLTELEGQLVRCSRSGSHFYPQGASRCSWCDLGKVGGFDMFPDLSVIGAAPTGSHNIEEAIKEILGIRFPDPSDVIAKSSVRVDVASNALKDARRSIVGRVVVGTAMTLGCIGGMVAAGEAWFVWLGAGIWGLHLLKNRKIESRPFIERFHKANDALQREATSYFRRNGLMEFIQLRQGLGRAIESYRAIDKERLKELASLKSTRESRQIAGFLDQFSIRNAKIPGIGPAKKATLISFGIETAADVTGEALRQVPGIGAVFTSRLMEWRRSHEAKFRYNSKRTPQDAADEAAINRKYSNRKQQLEKQIRDGVSALRVGRVRFKDLAARMLKDERVAQALTERAQAKNDLGLLKVLVPVTKTRY